MPWCSACQGLRAHRRHGGWRCAPWGVEPQRVRRPGCRPQRQPSHSALPLQGLLLGQQPLLQGCNVGFPLLQLCLPGLKLLGLCHPECTSSLTPLESQPLKYMSPPHAGIGSMLALHRIIQHALWHSNRCHLWPDLVLHTPSEIDGASLPRLCCCGRGLPVCRLRLQQRLSVPPQLLQPLLRFRNLHGKTFTCFSGKKAVMRPADVRQPIRMHVMFAGMHAC